MQSVRCHSWVVCRITVIFSTDVIRQDQQKVNLRCCIILQGRTRIKSLGHLQLRFVQKCVHASPEKFHSGGGKQNQKSFCHWCFSWEILPINSCSSPVEILTQEQVWRGALRKEFDVLFAWPASVLFVLNLSRHFAILHSEYIWYQCEWQWLLPYQDNG